MALRQQEDDFITLATRQCRLPGLTQSAKAAMGIGKLIQGRRLGATRGVLAVDAIKPGNCFDESCQASGGIDETRSLPVESGPIQQANYDNSDRQDDGSRSQNQDKESSARNHAVALSGVPVTSFRASYSDLRMIVETKDPRTVPQGAMVPASAPCCVVWQPPHSSSQRET